MTRDQVLALTRDCLDVVLRERPVGERIAITESTELLSDDSPFDSLEFVSFSTDLEGRLSRMTGRDLALVATALSDEANPFRTVGSLVDHITRRLQA